MALKVMILGANGMAGHMISDYLQENTDYFLTSLTRQECDFWEDNIFETIFNALKPDIVINCIGVLNTKANKIENLAETIYLNSLLPHFLSEFDTKVIHISSDCVFSGLDGPYKEDDNKDAHDTYGKTKFLGELDNNKDLTFRTSIIGPELKNGSGLFHWVMNAVEPVKGFSNVNWGGVTTLELAKAIHYAIENNVKGLFHLTNDTPITKLNLLELINVFFNLGLDFTPAPDPMNNRSLIKSRTGFDYIIPSYNNMVEELKTYMDKNPNRYENYDR